MGTNKIKLATISLWLANLFLAVALCVSLAHAERKLDLNIIAVNGYLAVSDDEVKYIYSQASHYFRELGLNLRVKYFREDKECPSGVYSIIREVEINCFQQKMKEAGFKRRRMVTYYMTPPWITVNKPVNQGGFQTTWMAGMAYRICSRVSTGNAVANNLPAMEPRLETAAEIMAHEIGHNLCATHVGNPKKVTEKECNLMHPDGGSCQVQFGILPVRRITKHQTKRFFARMRVRGKK